jgi:hypothetical protein
MRLESPFVICVCVVVLEVEKKAKKKTLGLETSTATRSGPHAAVATGGDSTCWSGHFGRF